jgi:hypothetical protein
VCLATITLTLCLSALTQIAKYNRSHWPARWVVKHSGTMPPLATNTSAARLGQMDDA